MRLGNASRRVGASRPTCRTHSSREPRGRWCLKPFDQQLYALKLREPAKRLHSETEKRLRQVSVDQRKNGQGLGPAWLAKCADASIDVLREYLEAADNACRETWLADGNSITPEFIRDILIPHISLVISVNTGGIRVQLEQASKRCRIFRLAPALYHLVHETQQLQADVSTRYEIEARTLEKQAVRSLPGATSTSVVPAALSSKESGSMGEEKDMPRLKADAWRPSAPPPLIEDLVNFSMPAGYTHADIVLKIAKMCGLRVEGMPDALSDAPAFRGRTTYGSAADVLGAITAGHENLSWTVSDGAIRFATQVERPEGHIEKEVDNRQDRARLTKSRGKTKNIPHQLLAPTQQRAKFVEKVIRELRVVKPRMHTEGHYERLRREHSQYLIFKVAGKDSDVKEWIENVQLRRDLVALAQEIAARRFKVSPTTVKTDWNHRRKPRRRPQ